MDNDDKRAHHDLGGVAKFMCEAVDLQPHALNDFDREVDALQANLVSQFSNSSRWCPTCPMSCK